MDRIQAMQEYGNMDGLLHVLRQDADPTLRARAARALGELGELEAADELTGAALNDPDPAVRQAARLGLHDLLGNQADLVLKLAESSGERDENWLEWQSEPSSLDDNPEESAISANAAQENMVDYETLRGLIMIARGDPSRDLRLRATTSLGRYDDMSAIRALAEQAMWDEDEGIRQAAESALRERFGERLAEVLDGFREEMEGGEEEEYPPEVYNPPAALHEQSSLYNQPQAQKVEAASTIGCLLLVFAFLALLYLILR